ncbi:hypothetical protein HDU99_003140 [Rhizoclosmatium hyalinum]|nr:hypothetical protein HDU99_003140 [Rhizoclosmatium hyalinum]
MLGWDLTPFLPSTLSADDQSPVPELEDVDPNVNQFSEKEASDVDQSQTPIIGSVFAPKTVSDVQQQDLLPNMSNVYRMLSLVQEHSSNGSVEKIVIDQQQFKLLCDRLVPGSYKSLAQVDYKALDSTQLNLVGIYGNKEMIANLLFEKGLLNEDTLQQLQVSTNDKTKYHENVKWFASGIYLAFIGSGETESGKPSLSGFAFYWPEDDTWEDSADQSVVKNRVSFMRFEML